MRSALKMFQEPNGKPSFGRVFGAAFLTSVLFGWWLNLVAPLAFGQGVGMPDITAELLLISIAPYGIGKVSGAFGRNAQPKAG